jgi:alpha-N-arabinofuranosidase
MKNKLLIIATFISLIVGSGNAQMQNKIVIDINEGKYTISKHVYGHFSEHLGRGIYGGIWVGEDSSIPNTRGIRNDVVEALKSLQIPNLRWPGGCFADEYHWRDGVGPREQRPKMINTHWGGVVEDNSFGTHEFLDLCEQLGCEPYICGNVGSGSVEEMSKWIEYMTFDGESPMANLRKQNGRSEPWKIRFFGVGNENWGCGGEMSAEFYADIYRRYAVYCRNYGDNRLYKIAGGPNTSDYHWTETLMKNVGHRMNALSLHYYTVPKTWGDKGSATVFDEAEYFTTIDKAYFMRELVEKHTAVMDKYDPQKKIALVPDEWGGWYNVEPGTNPGFLYQQNTLRDALLAAVTLDVFNQHCDRVKIANIAQMVNVLQSIILTDNEKMLLTPTYWVFDFYKVHQEATMLPLSIACAKYELSGKSIDAISASASRDKNGKIHITLSNVDPNKSHVVSCELLGGKGKKVSGKILTSNKITDHNTFDNPKVLFPKEFKDVKLVEGNLNITLPAKSVIVLEIN